MVCIAVFNWDVQTRVAISAYNKRSMSRIVDVDRCKLFCILESDFPCHSLDYNVRGGAQDCLLSEVIKDDVQPEDFSTTWVDYDYYEIIVSSLPDVQEDDGEFNIYS